VIFQHCYVHSSVAQGGRSDINQHLRSQKHKDAEKVLTSIKNVSFFMMRRDGDSERDKTAASEALVAYHTVHHGRSFRANDCLSTLIKTIHEPKFSSACTKSEIIEDLNKTKRITVSLDASNIKDIKLFPIVVRHFLPNCNAQDKIIDLISFPGETSNLQCAMLKK
jgi:hypothetical protein